MIGMTPEQKEKALKAARDVFQEKIIAHHQLNIDRSSKLSSYTPNPFLVAYLAQIGFGNTDSESLARALMYPRVLGPSVATTFGTIMQQYIVDYLGATASTTSGMDIEYMEPSTGRRIFCQVKAGPQTINKDDVATIDAHFNSITRLAHVNHMKINPLEDYVVGILYGTRGQLSGNYRSLEDRHHYRVLIGQEFWESLTGDPDFYDDLIEAMVSASVDQTSVLEDAVNRLARDIDKHEDEIPVPENE